VPREGFVLPERFAIICFYLCKSRILSILIKFGSFDQDGGWGSEIIQKERLVIKPNYKFEKRQKDLAKQKKKEEKRLKKMEKKTGTAETAVPSDGAAPAVE